jgi:glutathione S-transferase
MESFVMQLEGGMMGAKDLNAALPPCEIIYFGAHGRAI